MGRHSNPIGTDEDPEDLKPTDIEWDAYEDESDGSEDDEGD